MAILRQVGAGGASRGTRVGTVLLATSLLLTGLPLMARAFPDPQVTGLCSPERKAPPRLSPEEEIQAPSAASTPTVRILNPISGARVSDKYDGVDRRFHIVVIGVGLPADAILEATAKPGIGDDVVLGSLCPVPGTSETFEGFWDIPESFPEGPSALFVRAYDHGGDNPQVVASDNVRMDVQHRAEGTQLAAEDVRLQWPPNDGPLGFFRTNDGSWKTTLRVITPQSAGSPQISYSTTALGEQPSFKLCVSPTSTQTDRSSDSARIYDLTCALAKGDRPSTVTSLRAVAQSGAGASDSSRIHPFLQVSTEMSVDLVGIPIGSLSATHPTSRRRVAGSNCLQFKAAVKDRFGRPVPGVNLDAELRGPTDDASFGAAVSPAQAQDSGAPTESTVNCTSGQPTTGPSDLRQTRRLVADGPDRVSIESTTGTDDQGTWSFQIYSAKPGRSSVSVWVDSEPLEDELAERPPDDDSFDPDEGHSDSFGEWMEAALTLEVTPADEITQVGTCRIYHLFALGGRTPVSGLNVDIHARMPSPNFEICGPGTDSLRKPDSGHETSHVHEPDDAATSATGRICPGNGPSCYHFEGNTDENGELVFGIASASPGTSELLIWADGEPGQDDDVPPNEDPYSQFLNDPLYIRFATKWVDKFAGSPIKLLAPSDYDALPMSNGLQKVSSDSFRIIARASAPNLIDKATIEVTPPNSDETFEVGRATRIGNTNYYEMTWDLTRPLSAYGPSQAGGQPSPSSSPSATSSPGPLPSPSGVNEKPGVPDGTYKVTVRTERGFDVHALSVQRSDNPPNDATPPLEWATLTSPGNGRPLGFVDGETILRGSVSGGAEGVYFFYTVAGLTTKPVWKDCGFKTFSGIATAPVTFTDGRCKLKGTDQPSDVTGVAAVAWNCQVATPSCAAPTPPPIAGNTGLPRSGTPGAGDTLAVSGCEGNPCLVLAPGEWSADKATCVPFTAMVAQLDQAPSDGIVGVEFQGPTDSSRFCDPEVKDGIADEWVSSSETVETDQFGPDLHRIVGKAKNGAFTFGVRSDVSNFSSIYSTGESARSLLTAWVDDGDREHEVGEATARASVHWQLPEKCTVIGTSRTEILSGTVYADKLCAREGDDQVFAQEDNDLVLGGDGDDELFGDEGRDELFGEGGDDVLIGGPDSDYLDGGPGFDVCKPGPGKKQVVVNCEKVVAPEGSLTTDTIPSHVSVDFRKQTFAGLVDSATGCLSDRSVSIFRERDGRDVLIGTTRTDAKGRYGLQRDVPRGSYYALLEESIGDDDGKRLICAGAASRTVRV